MNHRFFPTIWLTAATAGIAVVLGGCATSDPDMISRDNAQTMSQVQDGVVLSVRKVTVDGSQSGVGAAIGGVVGAIGGSAGSGVATAPRESHGVAATAFVSNCTLRDVGTWARWLTESWDSASSARPISA
jgi:outer membrane lipoprotein SlyB